MILLSFCKVLHYAPPTHASNPGLCRSLDLDVACATTLSLCTEYRMVLSRYRVGAPLETAFMNNLKSRTKQQQQNNSSSSKLHIQTCARAPRKENCPQKECFSLLGGMPPLNLTTPLPNPPSLQPQPLRRPAPACTSTHVRLAPSLSPARRHVWCAWRGVHT